jgi:hypothetical protein
MKILVITLSCLLVLTLAHLREESEKESLTYKEDIQGCWLKAYGRGVGKPIHTCTDPNEKDGLLCYPKCKSGYLGVGPVCWQSCPDKFRDDGAFCFKPDSYGRGIGYALSNKSKCEAENPQGCEQWGLLLYPKCAASFHNAACCICSPNCPSGMTDIGISCAKDSYGRGAGTPLGCGNGEEYDTGLCYPPCQENFKSIGPVCWGSCPSGYTPCGALCLKDQSCANQIKQYFEGVVDIVKDFAQKNYVQGFIDIAKFAEGFIFDVCK